GQLSVRDQIAVIKEWLSHCDNDPQHQKCRCNTDDLPTRLIDVEDAYEVEIVESKTLPESKPKYLALSHYWGGHQCQSGKAHYQLRDGKRRFPFNKLPRIFQHVVTLTKIIGEQYLWIDLLYIN
ncbi:hypothetical protein BDP67DRAFT_425346, partial [Colletotrichum lupini]